MIIREAQPSDINQVLSLFTCWVAEGITYGQTSPTHGDLSQSLGSYFLVAADEERIIGFTIGSAHLSDGTAVIPEGKPYLEVDELYVMASMRSHGIGQLLLDELLVRAEANGMSYQMVYSATKDIHRIIHFYEQCGFASWYIQMYRHIPATATMAE